jgi:hypothetical protein
MSLRPVASGSLYLYLELTCRMTAPSASLRAEASVEEASALRIGEGIKDGDEVAASEIREGEASRDTTGCESPRSTRLMDVGL